MVDTRKHGALLEFYKQLILLLVVNGGGIFEINESFHDIF